MSDKGRRRDRETGPGADRDDAERPEGHGRRRLLGVLLADRRFTAVVLAARVSGTHNRYFATLPELRDTLISVFRSMQRCPDQIRGYLAPFV